MKESSDLFPIGPSSEKKIHKIKERKKTLNTIINRSIGFNTVLTYLLLRETFFLVSQFACETNPNQHTQTNPIFMARINKNINVDSVSCLSIGTCLCLTLGGSCSFATTEHQLPHKKRKRDLVLSNNTMAFDDDDGNTNVCLHILLGSPSCIPTCCCDEIETQIAKNHKRKYQEETKKHKTCKVDDQWEIKKVLETSNICKHKTRLLLNKDLAKKFVVPVLLDRAAVAFGKGGVQVQVWDIDTKSPHSVVFKYWPSAKSYVFTKTWTKEFVNRRELKKDDQIGLRWDQNNQRFDFSVLKKP